MNNLQVFDFEGKNVRVVGKNGEPWWVLKDVCEILRHSNPSVAIQLVDEDERAKQSLGRQGETWVVSESGLYALIIRSNLPEAKRFRKWITSEVLPSIKRTGSYSLNQLSPLEIMRNMIDEMITHDKKIQELQKKAEAHEEKMNKIQQAFSPLEKDESWRKWVNDAVRNMSFKDNVYSNTWTRLYEVLEERAHCDLHTRLLNLRERAAVNGLAPSKVKQLNNLDVIENEPRLKEIFTSIIREFTVSNVR